MSGLNFSVPTEAAPTISAESSTSAAVAFVGWKKFVFQLHPTHCFLIATSTAIAYMCLALFLGELDPKIHPSHFFKEGRVMTVTSSIILMSTGLLNFAIMYLRWMENKASGIPVKRYGIWSLMAAGFVVLGFDEVACYHEKFGDWASTFLSSTNVIAERLDSIILGLVAPIGLFCLWLFRREIMAFRHHWQYFALGVTLFATMIVADFITDDPDYFLAAFNNQSVASFAFHFLTAVEDLAKLSGVAAFFALFLGICHEVMKRSEPTESSPGV